MATVYWPIQFFIFLLEHLATTLINSIYHFVSSLLVAQWKACFNRSLQDHQPIYLAKNCVYYVALQSTLQKGKRRLYCRFGSKLWASERPTTYCERRKDYSSIEITRNNEIWACQLFVDLIQWWHLTERRNRRRDASQSHQRRTGFNHIENETANCRLGCDWSLHRRGQIFLVIDKINVLRSTVSSSVAGILKSYFLDKPLPTTPTIIITTEWYSSYSDHKSWKSLHLHRLRPSPTQVKLLSDPGVIPKMKYLLGGARGHILGTPRDAQLAPHRRCDTKETRCRDRPTAHRRS